MMGANLRAPNAITKNALSRFTSYEVITAALAELRNSLGFDSWNGLIAKNGRWFSRPNTTRIERYGKF